MPRMRGSLEEGVQKQMRFRRRRSKELTPEQEAQYEQAERIHTRARIGEHGVASLLNNGEYLNINELEEAARILAESINDRKHADALRDAVRKAEEANNPPVPAPKRGAKPRPLKVRR